MTTPPRKETISSRVLADLRQSILRGELPPDARINLDHLRDRFQTSISPLREALARLTGDGLVIFEDQRGFRVAPVSRAEYLDLAQLRAELEVKALTASIASGGMDWESGVVRALHLLLRAPTAEAHDAFHRALVAGAGRPQLLLAWSRLADLDRRYRNLAQLPTGSAAEHQAIASAATGRDRPAAGKLLRANLAAEAAAVLDHLPLSGSS